MRIGFRGHRIIDEQEQPLEGAYWRVIDHDGALVDLYADRDGEELLTNPLISGKDGMVSTFFVEEELVEAGLVFEITDPIHAPVVRGSQQYDISRHVF